MLKAATAFTATLSLGLRRAYGLLGWARRGLLALATSRV